MGTTVASGRFIRRFEDIGMEDLAQVGGKNASLGEMVRLLGGSGVRVPEGFAIAAAGYRHYLAQNELQEPINAILAGLDTNDLTALAHAGRRIRALIEDAELPDDLLDEIAQAHQALAERCRGEVDVAVRSSATAEDLPTASFAGQQDSFLHVRTIGEVFDCVRKVYASLFNDRAIAYRVHHGFSHQDVAVSVGIQRMVRADLGASGVMFTLDTETGCRDVVFITATWGLGETIVQGTVTPDEFLVHKPRLTGALRPILRRRLGVKAHKNVYGATEGPGLSRTIAVKVPEEAQRRFAIDDDDVIDLARQAVLIEQHYSKRAGKDQPMDIEWAKDGVTQELFIVQARPETVHSRAAPTELKSYRIERRGTVLAQGKSVGHGIGMGKARVIADPAAMHELCAGEVLVTDITDPDWEPIMKIAAGIVSNRGGRTCHAAIVARELGIPAVVGTGDGTRRIESGQEVTLSCAEGDVGYVYAGRVPFKVVTHRLGDAARPYTRVMMNIGDPDQAFRHALLPNDGVGLARIEFIISNAIRVHPAAILEFERAPAALRAEIAALSSGYADPREFYVERLAEGIATIAAAFYPRPVIVRFSDFKSNEYRALLGGAEHEPVEENPMLGWRGAARYTAAAFQGAFELECAALRRVREVKGLDNVAVMIPFVRTPAEARRALDLMASQGLVRGADGLKVYLMCEIPANALRADAFLDLCDGYSIGSNDLTQLTLGVDRDSALVTGTDERDPAVLDLMAQAIAACRRRGKYIGICGQAPSDYPEITRWLVGQGIDSISLSPDSVLSMTTQILAAEREHHTRARTGS